MCDKRLLRLIRAHELISEKIISFIIIGLLKRVFKRVISKLINFRNNNYVSIVSIFAPWVYVSYIPEVFRHMDDENYLDSHQNKREMIEIVKCFNSLGYNVYVQCFQYTRFLPLLPVRIVFGLEPNFERASNRYKSAFKVYYSTGAYYGHQNDQVIRMTDFVNKKYGSSIPYRRIVAPHRSFEIADRIICIGSSYTIDTFPMKCRNITTIINQSSQFLPVSSEFSYAVRNEFFLWLRLEIC